MFQAALDGGGTGWDNPIVQFFSGGASSPPISNTSPVGFLGPPTMRPAPQFLGPPVSEPPVFQPGKTDCATCQPSTQTVHDQIVQSAQTGTTAADAISSSDCHVCYGTFCAKCFFFWAFVVIFVLLAIRRG